jgi:hypothetical protein
MRIASYAIQANSRYEYQKTVTRTESLDFWVGQGTNRNPEPALPPSAAADRVSLTPEARAAQPAAKTDDLSEMQLTPKDKLMAEIIRQLMKAITGREFALRTPENLESKPANQTADSPASAPPDGQQPPPPTDRPAEQPSAGFGLVYDAYQTHHEYEAVSYTAGGVIKTQDGREIQFSVQLNMSREFYEERRESLRLGDAARKIDPLIVNFDGKAAELDPDTRFEFDLDSDGRSEQLAALKPGSGFLALDKNGDGTVNDGRELFGPDTGNGFAELAGYDEDGNGFIDEGDSVYDKLRIWLRNAAGGQQLVALGQVGIGAIYLGELATPFQFKGEDNHSLGELASTGLFFREDGSAGTIQQIDYVA